MGIIFSKLLLAIRSNCSCRQDILRRKPSDVAQISEKAAAKLTWLYGMPSWHMVINTSEAALQFLDACTAVTSEFIKIVLLRRDFCNILWPRPNAIIQGLAFSWAVLLKKDCANLIPASWSIVCIYFCKNCDHYEIYEQVWSNPALWTSPPLSSRVFGFWLRSLHADLKTGKVELFILETGSFVPWQFKCWASDPWCKHWSPHRSWCDLLVDPFAVLLPGGVQHDAKAPWTIQPWLLALVTVSTWFGQQGPTNSVEKLI